MKTKAVIGRSVEMLVLLPVVCPVCTHEHFNAGDGRICGRCLESLAHRNRRFQAGSLIRRRSHEAA